MINYIKLCAIPLVCGLLALILYLLFHHCGKTKVASPTIDIIQTHDDKLIARIRESVSLKIPLDDLEAFVQVEPFINTVLGRDHNIDLESMRLYMYFSDSHGRPFNITDRIICWLLSDKSSYPQVAGILWEKNGETLFFLGGLYSY